MNTEDALSEIEAALSRIDGVIEAGRKSAEFVAWLQSTRMLLSEAFGATHEVTQNFTATRYSIRGGETFSGPPWTLQEQMDRRNDVRFQEGMERQRGILSSALEHVGKFGLPDVTTSRPTGARVFISHGTAEDALDAIAHFVEDDLGLKAVVVKRSASEGAAVDDAVEGLLESCDAAVVLATADDHVGDGKMQPRPNVLHEIGLAQAKFPGRIIYLKETGATFPSNVAPKIWEDFTRENYGPAFKKIARELRAFGLL